MLERSLEASDLPLAVGGAHKHALTAQVVVRHAGLGTHRAKHASQQAQPSSKNGCFFFFRQCKINPNLNFLFPIEICLTVKWMIIDHRDTCMFI